MFQTYASLQFLISFVPPTPQGGKETIILDETG